MTANPATRGGGGHATAATGGGGEGGFRLPPGLAGRGVDELPRGIAKKLGLAGTAGGGPSSPAKDAVTGAGPTQACDMPMPMPMPSTDAAAPMQGTMAVAPAPVSAPSPTIALAPAPDVEVAPAQEREPEPAPVPAPAAPAASTVPAAPTPAAEPVAPIAASAATQTSSDVVQQVLQLVNAERAAAGVAPLTLDPALNQAAQSHSDQMASLDKMAHDGIGDGTMGERIRASGADYSRAAENVAFGSKTAEGVMRQWMGSDGHRRNILNPNLTSLGVGMAVAADGSHYWTQNFTG